MRAARPPLARSYKQIFKWSFVYIFFTISQYTCLKIYSQQSVAKLHNENHSYTILYEETFPKAAHLCLNFALSTFFSLEFAVQNFFVMCFFSWKFIFWNFIGWFERLNARAALSTFCTAACINLSIIEKKKQKWIASQRRMREIEKNVVRRNICFLK